MRRKQLSDEMRRYTRMLVISAAFIGALFAIKGIYPFGTTPIAYGDMEQSTVPFLYYIWDLWHGKATPFFTWRLAAGTNVTGLVSYQSMLSPFNFPILFVQRTNLHWFICVLIGMKMILMCMTMYAYLSLCTGSREWMRVLASLSYGCCACLLLNYTVWFMFDTAILLPILMIGNQRLIENGKPYVFLITVTLICVINAYIGLMVLLWICINAILHYAVMTKTDNDGSLKTLIDTMLYTLCGLMLSAVISVPAIVNMSSSSRLQESGIWNLVRIYLSATKNTSIEIGPKHFAGIAVPAALILFSFMRKGWKEQTIEAKEKIVVMLLMLLSAIIPGIELLWHGGSHVLYPLRFGFIVTFAILDCMVSVVDGKEGTDTGVFEQIRNAYLVVIAAGIAVILFRINGRDEKSIVQTLFIVGLIVGCFAVYTFVKTSRRWTLAALSIIDLGVSFLLLVAPANSTNGSAYVPDLQEEYIGDEIERVRDVDGIYATNYGLVTGKSTLSNYIGTLPAEYQNALNSLGYGTIYTRVLDAGGTAFTDALLNVRYHILDGDLEEANVSFPIAKVTSVIDASQEGSIFEFQNRIAESLTESTDFTLFEPVSVSNKSFDLTVNGNQRLYMYVPCADGYGQEGVISGVTINGSPVAQKHFEKGAYPSEYNVGILDLGEYSNQTIHVEIQTQTEWEGYDVQLALLDLDKLAEFQTVLDNKNKDTIYKATKTGMRVKGTTSKEGFMVLPLLYTDEWKCVVNGKKIAPEKAYDSFLAVPVSGGDYEIRIRYIPNGFVKGIVISIVGILVLLLSSRISASLLKRKELTKGTLEPVMICFIVMMYIVPIALFCFECGR